MKNNRLIIPLKTKKLFNQTFASRKIIKDATFTIKFLTNKLALSRYAIVIGKKSFKKAVQRNAIRRQIREMVRTFPNKSIDFIIIVSITYLKQSFATNKSLITKLYNIIK